MCFVFKKRWNDNLWRPKSIWWFSKYAATVHRLFLSKDKNDMIKNCELLFKNDIDRSKKYTNRTREEIITDRWIVYKQNDPSFDDVMEWFKSENISLYTSYPPTNQFSIDSHMNFPKKKLYNLKGINTINELFWMRKNKDDFNIINLFINKNKSFIKSQKILSKIFSDMRVDFTPKNKKKIESVLNNYFKSLDKIKTLENEEIESTKIFIKEIKNLLNFVKSKNFGGIIKTINRSKYLLKVMLVLGT